MTELLGQDKSEFNVLFVHSDIDDAGLSPAEFRVYAHLARRSNKGRAWPGIDSIARVCRLSKGTVIESIRTLDKNGMLLIKRKEGERNIYVLTKRSSWVINTLPTDQSKRRNGSNEVTLPVQTRERKVIQEGNPTPAGRRNEVINNQAEQIAALFKRRKNTPWSAKEIAVWKKLTDKGKRPLDDNEFAMVERYYAEARKKHDNYCRRDLYTFLNNYAGEVDRARSWCEKHPLKSARKIVHHNDESILETALASRPPEMDPAQTKAFCEKFERQYDRLPAGYKRDGEEIIFVGNNGAK